MDGSLMRSCTTRPHLYHTAYSLHISIFGSLFELAATLLTFLSTHHRSSFELVLYLLCSTIDTISLSDVSCIDRLIIIALRRIYFQHLLDSFNDVKTIATDLMSREGGLLSSGFYELTN
ncbi:uncharacterized protein LAESUDRAFT_294444 [Laetiporus sulphureus 93-53]|uniref:Uncharacterized protein n=1 Tax=Laetiporus sulphureus 93-53 TaxID=1314785 RepID=A0A165DAM9_9APHY|nr:uncharacterized protein LAESUDRAFT_294444 [Laetiporus sulphureus 93-53]KZT04443.1 hypothetical protein LAESUDRAFT_294444 [Laetiporus sulphureus 93-53]